MSNDPTFVRTNPSDPGDIGQNNPGKGKFTQVDVEPTAENPYGVRILVTDPSAHVDPQGALKIDVTSPSDPNPALNIDNKGTGPDIQLATGVTITEVGGQLYFEDPVAGPISLAGLGAGTGSNVNVGGVGVFEADVAGNLQFRGVAAASSRVAVSLDAPTKEIRVDVNQTNLVLTASQISNFSSAVAATASVTANTAKVSASGSIATHMDVDLTGIQNGEILSLQGSELRPLALSAANASYDDSSTSLGASDVQGAVEALDTKIDAIEASPGESNDGANVNLAGIGVYDSKGGVILRFRGVAAASSRVSVSLNASNKTVDLDVNQTNLVLTASQISDFSTAVSANADVTANTAKVSAGGPVSTHSDVAVGATTDQILRRSGGGVWTPQDLTAQITQFDDSGVAFTAAEVQTALDELDAIVALNTVKVSADGSVSTHSDVSLSGISSGQHLEWDGSKFVPGDGSYIKVSSTPVTDNRVVRFDGTTGKLAQQSPVGISDTGTIHIAGASPELTAAGSLLVQPTGNLTLRAGGTGKWLHADGTTALEITPIFGGSLVIHDLIRSPAGTDIQMSPGRHLLLTPTYETTIRSGTGYETKLQHGVGGDALKISSGVSGASDGVLLSAAQLLPAGPGRKLGHVSVTGRQFEAVYSKEFSGGENWNSILKAQAGREARLESADAVARVQVSGDSGDVSLNGDTWVNGIFSVYAGQAATAVSAAGDRHKIFVDTLTGELSVRKIGGDLVSLEGGGGSGPGAAPTRGQVVVSTPIPAGDPVTALNITILPNSNGLQPYTSAEDFVASTMIYHNGQMLTAGESLADDPDVYPAGSAASGEFALTRPLQVGDVLQVLKFSILI